MRYGVIMAGGSGERFWPLSRKKKPKQLLKLSGDMTLLDESILRLIPVIPEENIFVSTSIELKESILAHTKHVGKDRFICEPFARNTAPCLGLSAIFLRKKFGDVTMAVMTADHRIGKLDLFRETIDVACNYAEKEACVVVFGIPPSRPEVGYGYIEADHEVDAESDLKVYKVKQFREKPNFKLATEFIKRGNFYWNSGMFVWRVSTILQAFAKHLPEIYEGLLEIEKALDTTQESKVLSKVFDTFPKISIDYGIMEHIDNVYVVRSEFLWDDVGSWDALERTRVPDVKGNITHGKCLTFSTQKSIVYNDSNKEMLIATLGVNNLVIVLTDDALIVCDKDKCQDIKIIVEHMKENDMENFL